MRFSFKKQSKLIVTESLKKIYITISTNSEFVAKQSVLKIELRIL